MAAQTPRTWTSLYYIFANLNIAVFIKCHFVQCVPAIAYNLLRTCNQLNQGLLEAMKFALSRSWCLSPVILM